MKRTTIKRSLVTTAIVAATAVITSTVVSQMQHETPDNPYAAKAMQRMEKWTLLGQPGPEHRRMAQTVGQWQQKNTHWMYPGAEPMVSESTATIEPMFDGRYLIQRSKGAMEWEGQTMEFEGFGLFGFDNYTKKHFFAWTDNWSTMMMTGEGEADESGNVVTYYAEMPDPTDGSICKWKCINTVVNKNKTKFEMHEKLDDGTWFKHVEIVSTR